MAESEEELKSQLMKVKEENEKVGLKVYIQKTKIMASGPITSCKQMEKQWKQWQTLIFLGAQITANGNCRHEIKRCLLLGRKAMTNLKQRHYFANKGLFSQGYGFSSGHVWM